MLILYGSRIPIPCYAGPREMSEYGRKLGAARRAEMEAAARICAEAGATAEQAAGAAAGNPVLDGLAEAMAAQA